MPEHANAALVRRMFEAFAAGDLATVQNLIDQNAVWHFPGRRGKLAGDHRGQERIFAFLFQVQSLTDGTFHLDLIDVAASDEHAVALFRGHGTRDGKILDNPTCLRIRIQGGKAAEFWEFVWDLDHVEEFWS